MNIFSKIMLVAAIVVAPALSDAQNAKSYDQLSNQYKYEIDAVNSELKANKKRQKANPGDEKLKQDEAAKHQELETLKLKKKAVDQAIDAQKDCEKAQKRQEEAREDAEKAQSRVKKAKEAADKAIGANPEKKTYDQLSNQYKYEIDALETEIKANKKRQKANPGDDKLKQEEAAKRQELTTLKAKRKLVDEYIDADNDHKRAVRKATEAQEDAEKALSQAKSKAAEADKILGR